jgi:hypothetical protein
MLVTFDTHLDAIIPGSCLNFVLCYDGSASESAAMLFGDVEKSNVHGRQAAPVRIRLWAILQQKWMLRSWFNCFSRFNRFT